MRQAIGVDLDLVEKGLGVRSRRYAMLVDDGTVMLFPADDMASCMVSDFAILLLKMRTDDAQVTDINLEEGGAFTTSGADGILAVL